jgi:hypothetical protein
MKRFFIFGVLLLLPIISESQTTCFRYQGGMVSCDSERGNMTQVPFSSSSGVITRDGPSGSSLEPYTIFPPVSSSSSRHDSGFSSRPLEPLNRLDRLDRLDRLSDPLSDPLLPLLLGE